MSYLVCQRVCVAKCVKNMNGLYFLCGFSLVSVCWGPWCAQQCTVLRCWQLFLALVGWVSGTLICVTHAWLRGYLYKQCVCKYYSESCQPRVHNRSLMYSCVIPCKCFLLIWEVWNYSFQVFNAWCHIRINMHNIIWVCHICYLNDCLSPLAVSGMCIRKHHYSNQCVSAVSVLLFSEWHWIVPRGRHDEDIL